MGCPKIVGVAPPEGEGALEGVPLVLPEDGTPDDGAEDGPVDGEDDGEGDVPGQGKFGIVIFMPNFWNSCCNNCNNS